MCGVQVYHNYFPQTTKFLQYVFFCLMTTQPTELEVVTGGDERPLTVEATLLQHRLGKVGGAI